MSETPLPIEPIPAWFIEEADAYLVWGSFDPPMQRALYDFYCEGFSRGTEKAAGVIDAARGEGHVDLRTLAHRVRVLAERKSSDA